MGSESRRMPRRTVSGLIDVVDAMTEESIGHLGNLSVGGMLLIARAPLAEDGLYQLRFSLPDTEEPLEVGARFLGLAPALTRRLREWTHHAEGDGH